MKRIDELKPEVEELGLSMDKIRGGQDPSNTGFLDCLFGGKKDSDDDKTKCKDGDCNTDGRDDGIDKNPPTPIGIF